MGKEGAGALGGGRRARSHIVDNINFSFFDFVHGRKKPVSRGGLHI